MSPHPWKRAVIGLCGLFSSAATILANPDGPIPGLTVKAVMLCERVTDTREPLNEFAPDSTVLHGPVSLWSVLSGTKTTLQELRKRGMLPIRHRWLFNPRVTYEDSGPVDQLADPEAIKVGTITQLKRLGAEAASGAFDWRTWSCKRALRSGEYKIEVLFNNYTPVLDRYGKPCVVRFTYEPKSR